MTGYKAETTQPDSTLVFCLLPNLRDSTSSILRFAHPRTHPRILSVLENAPNMAMSVAKFTACAALLLAAAPTAIDAHAMMSVPKPNSDGEFNNNSPAFTISGPKTLPSGTFDYNQGPEKNYPEFIKQYKASGTSSLRDLVAKASGKAGGSICGNTKASGTPQPLPDQVVWTGFSGSPSHLGPCEVWCDDKMHSMTTTASRTTKMASFRTTRPHALARRRFSRSGLRCTLGTGRCTRTAQRSVAAQLAVAPMATPAVTLEETMVATPTTTMLATTTATTTTTTTKTMVATTTDNNGGNNNNNNGGNNNEQQQQQQQQRDTNNNNNEQQQKYLPGVEFNYCEKLLYKNYRQLRSTRMKQNNSTTITILTKKSHVKKSC